MGKRKNIKQMYNVFSAEEMEAYEEDLFDEYDESDWEDVVESPFKSEYNHKVSLRDKESQIDWWDTVN